MLARAWRVAAVVAGCLGFGSLAGCLLPYDFEAALTVEPDGSYYLDLEGKLVALEFFHDLKEGRISSDDPLLKDVARTLRAYKEIYHSRYLGNGIYDTKSHSEGELSDEFVSIAGGRVILRASSSGNDVTIENEEFRRNFYKHDIAELAAAGIHSRGRFCVMTRVAVLESNAMQTANSNGGGTKYCWIFEDWMQKPLPVRIVLRFEQPIVKGLTASE